MGEQSKIEWTEHTFNPWWGCAKVSPGCKNCYAETLSNRYHPGHWGINADRKMMSESYWRQPVKWNRMAGEGGRMDRVFCASMADVFEDRPDLVEPRHRLFELIEQTPNLMWLLLTKRPENVLDMVWWGTFFDLGTPWPDNVCIMTSVEDQETANVRIPQLLAIKAKYRALSVEPLLGPVDLTSIRFPNDRGGIEKWDALDLHLEYQHLPEAEKDATIHWVIVGGESGPGARPMHPDWARSIRDQCVRAGVAFHFKQHGRWISGEDIDSAALMSPQQSDPDEYFKGFDFEDGVRVWRVGKKKAGRLLDGREWNEQPFGVEVST